MFTYLQQPIYTHIYTFSYLHIFLSIELVYYVELENPIIVSNNIFPTNKTNSERQDANDNCLADIVL